MFGGDQLRPNIHIVDMVEAYICLLRADEGQVVGQVLNAGYENQPVKEIANIVKEVVGPDVRLIATPTDDNRSYHISSEKIRNEIGFVPRNTIRDAVVGLLFAFQTNQLPNSLDDERYFNIKRMQSLNLK